MLQFEVEQKAAADACEDGRTHQALHVAEGQAAEQFPRKKRRGMPKNARRQRSSAMWDPQNS